jgi:hypothetical protein
MRGTVPPLPVVFISRYLMKHRDFYYHMKQNLSPTNPIWTLHTCEVCASEIASGFGRPLVCLLNEIVFKLRQRSGHATVDLQL